MFHDPKITFATHSLSSPGLDNGTRCIM